MLVPDTFDAALLIGPMYHIVEQNECVKVLHELKRILKPHGVAIIAYLNSWGLIKTGVTDIPNWYKEISVTLDEVRTYFFRTKSIWLYRLYYWSTPKAALVK